MYRSSPILILNNKAPKIGFWWEGANNKNALIKLNYKFCFNIHQTKSLFLNNKAPKIGFWWEGANNENAASKVIKLNSNINDIIKCIPLYVVFCQVMVNGCNIDAIVLFCLLSQPLDDWLSLRHVAWTAHLCR